MRETNPRSRRIQDNRMEPRSLISMEYEPADNGGAAGHLYAIGGGLFASATGAAFA